MSPLPTYKKIAVLTQQPANADRIRSEFQMSAVAARVLAARGFEPGTDLKDFLNPSLKEGLPHPQLLKGLTEGVALVREVVERGEKIAIACDFDVDGLTGGAQLFHFFTTIGAQPEIFVPDRFLEGYGLNDRIIREAKKKGCTLLITVDYGTKSVKEIALARDLGLKTIVIDHHAVEGECAEPDVCINPQQAECAFANRLLSASGLAWYFLVGLRPALSQAATVDVREYLDLACLGTICDMVPLLGANRVIAKRGLEVLSRSDRPGLQALKRVAGISDRVTCYDVGFTLGPRINAAGRMVHGEMVVELLTTTSRSHAERVAKDLHELNQERQTTEKITKEEALLQVKAQSELPDGIVVWGEEFHTGVIGLVAQRLVENYYRPAAVIGKDDKGEYKGSVRGIRGFNVVAALGMLSSYLIKFGGHEGAGGFAINDSLIPAFQQAFAEEVRRQLPSPDSYVPFVQGDTATEFQEISLALVEELERLAPFGIGNNTPTFVTRNVEIQLTQIIKDTHLKVHFTDGKKKLVGLLWRHTSHPCIEEGQRVTVAYRIAANTFRGSTELTMHIQAVEKCEG